jgi:predicted nicotinamide N-methyase
LDDHFPYSLIRYKVSGVTIFIPDPGNVKELYEHEKDKGSKPFPFWTRVWPSALALSTFIEGNRHYVEGKKILELGAGLAIPSFMAARYAQSVLTSDYIEDAVMLMKHNIDVLALHNIRAEQIDWHDLPAGISADTVLLSDVNYSPPAFEALHKAIEQFLNMGSVIILTTPGRIVSKAFIDFLIPYIAYREMTDIEGTEVLLAVLIKKPG